MDHSLSVRVPSLVAGKRYVMKVWTRQPMFAEVKFLGFTQDGVVREKIPQINKMTDSDLMHFERNGVVIFGIQRDQCLVLRESGVRCTFFKIEGASDVSEGAVGVVVGTKQYWVAEESKEDRKRRLDRDRKRALRAAAKQA